MTENNEGSLVFHVFFCRKSVSKSAARGISHQNLQQSREKKLTRKIIHTVLVQVVTVPALLVQVVTVPALLVQVV